MLVIIIIALIASSSFRKVARKKGYESPRFWAYPLIVGSVILFVSFWIGIVAGMITDGEGIMALYPFVVSVLAIALECAILSKMWKQIKQLPDRCIPTKLAEQVAASDR